MKPSTYIEVYETIWHEHSLHWKELKKSKNLTKTSFMMYQRNKLTRNTPDASTL